jgi:hypothetical protein
MHYSSPLITRGGTVVFPVKTTASGKFILDGRKASNGVRRWSFASDYIMPAAGWRPLCGTALVTNPTNRAKASAVIVGSGGKLFVRDFADEAVSRVRTIFFYNAAAYKANPAIYDSTVFINTPLTVDNAGNIYFGVRVTGANPLNLKSGIAKVNLSGAVTFATISQVTGGALTTGKVATNCAPALSNDGQTLYFAVNETTPSLIGVQSSNLAPKHRRSLVDPFMGTAADVNDLSTSSPMIGPDGSVFYGVIENPWGWNRLRGWMMRFSASLAPLGAPGAFGWDNTPSVVPRSAVPSYKGSAPYLLFTKYNHYAQTGGDGMNKLAVLDPFATQVDPVTQRNVMKEVITVVGPTPDPNLGGVREWCVNTAAVDVAGKSAFVNCEDGLAYRWDFRTNTLSQGVQLTAGIGEAYTPTIIGPDGRGYAINNAVLYVVGSR